MDLKVTKDSPDFGNITAGIPPIKTQSVETNVLVDNGETIVLGGVYEQTTAKPRLENTDNRFYRLALRWKRFWSRANVFQQSKKTSS